MFTRSIKDAVSAGTVHDRLAVEPLLSAMSIGASGGVVSMITDEVAPVL